MSRRSSVSILRVSLAAFLGFFLACSFAAGPVRAQPGDGSAEIVKKVKKKANKKKGKKKARKKKRGYTPQRLWYRLQLDFKGSKSGLSADGAADYESNSTWRLSSNTAVRVTLACVNRKFPDKPFTLNKVIGKTKGGVPKYGRPIGGCDTRTPNLMPTAKFNANGAGGVTAWNFEENLVPSSCVDGTIVTTSQILTPPQTLVGSLFSRSSATQGLGFTSNPIFPGGIMSNISTSRPATSCLSPAGPNFIQAFEGERLFHPTDFFGNEPVVNQQQISESMRFKIAPRRFGQTMVFKFAVGQPFNPIPPALDGQGTDPGFARNYQYKLKLKACPKRGRNVKAC